MSPRGNGSIWAWVGVAPSSGPAGHLPPRGKAGSIWAWVDVAPSSGPAGCLVLSLRQTDFQTLRAVKIGPLPCGGHASSATGGAVPARPYGGWGAAFISPDGADYSPRVGGTHSASDTPRGTSGLWSQCPWGSPALRMVVVAGRHVTGCGGGPRRGWAEQSPAPTEGCCSDAGGRRPLIRHGLWPCHLLPKEKAARDFVTARHPSGRAVFVTGVRAAESSAPTAGSMPCAIQPTWVGIVTWAAGDS